MDAEEIENQSFDQVRTRPSLTSMTSCTPYSKEIIENRWNLWTIWSPSLSSLMDSEDLSTEELAQTVVAAVAEKDPKFSHFDDKIFVIKPKLLDVKDVAPNGKDVDAASCPSNDPLYTNLNRVEIGGTIYRPGTRHATTNLGKRWRLIAQHGLATLFLADKNFNEFEIRKDGLFFIINGLVNDSVNHIYLDEPGRATQIIHLINKKIKPGQDRRYLKVSYRFWHTWKSRGNRDHALLKIVEHAHPKNNMIPLSTPENRSQSRSPLKGTGTGVGSQPSTTPKSKPVLNMGPKRQSAKMPFAPGGDISDETTSTISNPNQDQEKLRSAGMFLTSTPIKKRAGPKSLTQAKRPSTSRLDEASHGVSRPSSIPSRNRTLVQQQKQKEADSEDIEVVDLSSSSDDEAGDKVKKQMQRPGNSNSKSKSQNRENGKETGLKTPIKKKRRIILDSEEESQNTSVNGASPKSGKKSKTESTERKSEVAKDKVDTAKVSKSAEKPTPVTVTASSSPRATKDLNPNKNLRPVTPSKTTAAGPEPKKAKVVGKRGKDEVKVYEKLQDLETKLRAIRPDFDFDDDFENSEALGGDTEGGHKFSRGFNIKLDKQNVYGVVDEVIVTPFTSPPTLIPHAKKYIIRISDQTKEGVLVRICTPVVRPGYQNITPKVGPEINVGDIIRVHRATVQFEKQEDEEGGMEKEMVISTTPHLNYTLFTNDPDDIDGLWGARRLAATTEVIHENDPDLIKNLRRFTRRRKELQLEAEQQLEQELLQKQQQQQQREEQAQREDQNIESRAEEIVQPLQNSSSSSGEDFFDASSDYPFGQSPPPPSQVDVGQGLDPAPESPGRGQGSSGGQSPSDLFHDSQDIDGKWEEEDKNTDDPVVLVLTVGPPGSHSSSDLDSEGSQRKSQGQKGEGQGQQPVAVGLLALKDLTVDICESASFSLKGIITDMRETIGKANDEVCIRISDGTELQLVVKELFFHNPTDAESSQSSTTILLQQPYVDILIQNISTEFKVRQKLWECVGMEVPLEFHNIRAEEFNSEEAPLEFQLIAQAANIFNFN